MLDQLESNYDCANAGEDLQQLLSELERLKQQDDGSQEMEERCNRVENQIHFIRNKCAIH